jgi:hypothetical protein
MEGKKYDSGKPRYDLIPSQALEEIVKALTFGASKYEDDNWHKVEPWDKRYYGALIRHLNQWKRQEGADPESGLNHLAHAGACLLFLLANEISLNKERTMSKI